MELTLMAGGSTSSTVTGGEADGNKSKLADGFGVGI